MKHPHRAYVPATTVVDMGAPDFVSQLLAFHRETFGSAVMEDAGAAPSAVSVPPVSTPAAPTPTAPVPTPPLGAPTPQAPAAPVSQTPEVKATDPVDVSTLPVNVQHLIAQVRQEAANSRTKLSDAETSVLRQLAEKAGITLPDETPTVESLTAKLTEAGEKTTAAEASGRQAMVELAVFRAAAANAANPEALLDSRTFLEEVAKLDPAEAEFQTKVGDAIKKAVTANPRLGATATAVTASTVDHQGTPPGPRVIKPLSEAVAGKYAAAPTR